MVKIMVVDDEKDLREMLNLMLQTEGYEMMMAENGSDFLDKVDSFNPDLVTLDVMMPGLKTEEILKKLKGKHSNPKIILCTVVRYSDEEKEKIFSLGNVVDYVMKPFDMDRLFDSINKHI